MDKTAENTESAGMWSVPRDARRGALQLARRQRWPDTPFIHGEIQSRMLERSEIMRLPPGCVLDMSLGRADVARQLAARFSDRDVHVTRWCEPLPMAAEDGWFGRQLRRLIPSRQDAPQLAGSVTLADETTPLSALPPVAMVWSNALLHRAADPRSLVARWRQALVPGGALFFACFGPDTAPELGAVANALKLPFPDFADMHDWGDLLVKSGFSDPVMEMEKLVLTYRRVEDLLRDWHALGGNPAATTVPGLRGRQFRTALYNCLQNPQGGNLQISLEILYGHAWRVDRKPKGTEFSIPVSEIRRKPA